MCVVYNQQQTNQKRRQKWFWKLYNIDPRSGIVWSPMMARTVVVSRRGIVVSNRKSKKNKYTDGYHIEQGIHVFNNKSSLKQEFKWLAHKKWIIIKVLANAKDLIGSDKETSAFMKIKIQPKDLKKYFKHKKNRR